MGNPFDTENPPLAVRVLSGILQINTAMKAQAWQQAGHRRLTPTQGQILALLRRRGEGMRLSEVAEGLGVSLPTASDAVSSLTQKGFARKDRSDLDARAVRVQLTAEGETEAAGAAGWPDFLLQGLGEMNPAEQEIFLRGVVKIVHSLEEGQYLPSQRMCITCKHFRPHVHGDSRRPHHCALLDAPFGGADLRLDCAEQEPADAAKREQNWRAFRADKRAG
jgi:DNA-binding MarR family transcriptional regulator